MSQWWGSWVVAGLAAAISLGAHASPAPLPPRLHDTGLYVGGTLQVRPENRAFTPQYALWSDGAIKRRWIQVPAGSFIDATQPQAWQFPPGTKLWKEFGYAGRPVETRYVERLADGSWRFAAYVWNDAGTDAVLAPAHGLPGHLSSAAPDGRYDIPAQDDCRACHEGARAPVLGFSALQLSPDRDPLAPHRDAARDGLDLADAVALGLVRNLPATLLAQPPRIPAARPLERAVLGYLHANCGHCHNATDAAPPVDLRLEQTGAGTDVAAALESLTQGRMQYRPDAAPIVPGDARASVLVARLRSRAPADQMPPLGTRHPDPEGIALVERWIDSLEPPQELSR